MFRPLVATAAVAAAAVSALSLAFVPGATAQSVPRAPRAFLSDDRASFVVNESEVTGKPTCADWASIVPSLSGIGLQTATQAGWYGSTASNGVISGMVTPPTAPATPGKLDVTVTPPDSATVRILAVIVYGGGGYQLYTDPAVLPRTEPGGSGLPSPQGYQPPTNHGNNPEAVGQWQVCYAVTFPPPPARFGNLALSKTLVTPEGVPEGLPSGYTASVACTLPDGGGTRDETVTFTAIGGSGTPSPVFPDTDPLPEGTTCTVAETTGSLSPMPAVTYTVNGGPPATAPARVTIASGETSQVTIVNTFSSPSVPAERGTVRVEKEVRNHHGAPAPRSFSADVACDDQAGTTTVRLPGAGGAGTPLAHPDVGVACTVKEFSVPSGWTVTYFFNGREMAAPPTVEIDNTTPITVTVINTARASAAPPPVPVTG